MTWYLQSPPGRPLHLTVWACDRDKGRLGVLPYVTGRPVPICGQDRGVTWTFTGPLAEKWDASTPICSHCQAELAKLNAAAGDPR